MTNTVYDVIVVLHNYRYTEPAKPRGTLKACWETGVPTNKMYASVAKATDHCRSVVNSGNAESYTVVLNVRKDI